MTAQNTLRLVRARDQRDDRKFDWSAHCGMPTLGALAGVPLDQLFVDAHAIAQAWRIGALRARALFGPDVGIPTAPSAAKISYSHINTLGVELLFPPGSEVGCVRGIHKSLAEGIDELERLRDVDFTRCGRFPLQMAMLDQLQKLVPEVNVGLSGLGFQGPITTACLLRGDGLWLDLYDQPDLVDRYLMLVTDSIVRFARTLRRIDGHSESAAVAWVFDDLASMIRPDQWPRFVLPCHHRYFQGLTTDRRGAHIENLIADHLPFLDELGLDSYDPSVSPKLTAALVRDRCTVPFNWRLNVIQMRQLNVAGVARFVVEAAAAGAKSSHLVIEPVMCDDASVAKIKAFITAARRVQQLLAAGIARNRLTVAYADN